MPLLPPMLMKLRITEEGRRKLALWLPLFLIWPFIFVLALAAVPLLLVMAIFLGSHAWRLILAAPQLYSMACATRGTLIEVTTDQEEVFISIH